MKTLLVILMSLGMFFETQAQKGFKKIFDLDSIDNFSWSGTNYNGKYYVSNVSSTKTYFLEMYTLDVNGEFVEKNHSPFWFKYLYEPRFFVLDSAIYNYGMFQGKLNDTLYEDLIKGYVYKTNLKGDSIFFTNYFGKHTDFTIYKGVSLNHELYFAGVFAYNAMLLKIDTSGTFLWEKEWATENYFDGFEGLTSTRDTFLVGVGYTNGKGKDTTHTARNGLIVKMDTSGKVIWEQIINDPDDSVSSVFFRAVTEDSKNDIIAGALAYSSSGRKQNLIVKLNKDGKIKWLKKYYKPFDGFYQSSLKNLVATDDGSVVSGGGIDYLKKDSVNGDQKFYSEASLMKFDSLGNIIWYKTYTYDLLSKKINGTFFRDISKTEDGGFLGVGQILYDLGFEGRLNDWDMFVVKTDSNGCLVQGCDSLTLVTEWNSFSPIKNSIESIYPNPTSGIFSVIYSVSEQSTSKILVFDLLGKMQKEILLDGYEKQKIMDLKGLENGVYLLQLEVNEQLRDVKRVVITR